MFLQRSPPISPFNPERDNLPKSPFQLLLHVNLQSFWSLLTLHFQICVCSFTLSIAAHNHQSIWLLSEDDRFIVLTIRAQFILHSGCPSMSLGFNFQRWYLRQNEARSSAGPVWPTKSRHSRAALEFNQLFEQLSVLGHTDSSSA